MATILGLTGPTGSGKSTVADFFRKHGCAVIDCDRVSKEITVPGSAALQAIADAFGQEVLAADGSLNRRKLADIAFANAESTAKLNAVTHPFIMDAIRAKIDAAAATGVRAILLDAPTLYEAGADCFCDRVIAVCASVDKRRQRICSRDELSLESANTRIGAGKPDSFYAERADDMIYNNADKDSLTLRLIEIWHKYIRLFRWEF